MGNHSKGPFDLSTYQANKKEKKGTPGYQGTHRQEDKVEPKKPGKFVDGKRVD